MADNAQLTIKFNKDGILIEGTASKPDIISAALLLLGTIEAKDASTWFVKRSRRKTKNTRRK